MGDTDAASSPRVRGLRARRVVVVLAATVGLVVVASAAAGAESSVSALLLKPAQVGPGYSFKLSSGVSPGLSTGGCAGYPIKDSKLEVAQAAQVYADSSDSSKPLVANAVIRYQPGAAAHVLHELRVSVLHCPRPDLLPGTHSKVHLALVTVPQLAPPYVAVRIWQASTSLAERSTIYGVAERRGDEISIVDGFSAGGEPVQSLVFHAARVSARNLG